VRSPPSGGRSFVDPHPLLRFCPREGAGAGEGGGMSGGVMKILCLSLIVLFLSGCGAISATTLRCGTDGESSYLELVSAPQNVSGTTRAIGEMCAFAYEGGE
jgi:hypothetical protein